MAKELSGSLSKNKRKEKETHPDYRGSCLIDGTDYWISAWIKEGEDGKWMSLAFQVKDEAKTQLPKVSGGVADLTDDIPF